MDLTGPTAETEQQVWRRGLRQVTSANQSVLQRADCPRPDNRCRGGPGWSSDKAAQGERQPPGPHHTVMLGLALEGVRLWAGVGPEGREWGTKPGKGAPGRVAGSPALGRGPGLHCVWCDLPSCSHAAQGPRPRLPARKCDPRQVPEPLWAQLPVDTVGRWGPTPPPHGLSSVLSLKSPHSHVPQRSN